MAIDQGVGTFATTYSDSEVIMAGDKFANRTLLPLMRKVDRLISQKRKLENIGDNKKEWYRDRVRYLDKKISKLKAIKDESYTSKTYSWNGFVDDKLKSKKVIKFQNMLIDRDINGARGILIKQLSKVA